MNLLVISQSYWKYSECYTTERFNTHIDMKALWSGFATKNIYSRGDFQGSLSSKILKSTEYSRRFSVLKILLNWIRPAKFPVLSLALNKVGSTKSRPTSTNRVNPTCLLHHFTTDILSTSSSPRRPKWGTSIFQVYH